MPYKHPEIRRKYYRLDVRRKELRDAYDSMEVFGGNGRPRRKPSLEELEVDLDLVWHGVKSKPWEPYYASREAAAKIRVHPNKAC